MGSGLGTRPRPDQSGLDSAEEPLGQFMLVGLMEPGGWARLGVKGQEGARQGWKESQGIMGKRQPQRSLNLAFKALIHLAQPHLDLLTSLNYLELLGHSMLFLASAIWHLLLILFFFRCLSLYLIHLASSYSSIKTQSGGLLPAIFRSLQSKSSSFLYCF